MRVLEWFVAAVLALQAPPQQTGTGVIQGRVLRAGGTEPIVDAQVILNRGTAPAGGGGGQRGAGGAGGPTASAITDDSGGFVFKDLAPGRYTVTAGHKKYSGPLINSPDPSAGVTVANGQTTEALITMTPTSVIRGRIRDASGQFASNVQVEALVISYTNGLPFLMPAIAKESDDRGEYRLYGIPPGDYYIGATPRPPSAIAALAGGDRSVKTFFPNEFDISRATKITIHGGEEIQNIDIAIQTPQMFRISGTVSTTVPVAAPSPTAQGAFAVIQQNQNATIQLVLNSRDLTKPEGGNSGGTSVSVTAASAGPFEIANVLPGSYDLMAIFNGNSATPAIARTVVDVRNQDVGGLVMTIRAGLQAQPAIAKANADEMKAAFGDLGQDPHQIASSIKARRSELPPHTVVTLGSSGAIYMNDGAIAYARPPRVSMGNPIGAGDSFAAGFIKALLDQKAPSDALRFATAVAVSDVFTPEPGTIVSDKIGEIVTQTSVERW